jgi:hypothetical protein
VGVSGVVWHDGRGHDTLKVAERCEAELGEEQWSFIEGCPRDWGNLPIPERFLTPQSLQKTLPNRPRKRLISCGEFSHTRGVDCEEMVRHGRVLHTKLLNE